MDNAPAGNEEPLQKLDAGQDNDDPSMSEEAKQFTAAAPWGAPVESTDAKTSGEIDQESHFPHQL